MISYWNDISFANPEFFYLLLLLPLLVFWHWKKQQRQVKIKLPTLEGAKRTKPSWRVKSRPLLFVFRVLAIILLVVALARPRTSFSEDKVETEGIDIILATDVSTSMLAEDFKPNRIEAAKKVAETFISGRPDDRMGLVVFAGESFTQCPLTTDHQVLTSLLSGVKSGIIEDGTAIGMGLATAVNRLKESNAESKVVILLTDGVNNAGFVDPITAAEIATKFNIRVYTIGVGTRGKAPYPFETPFGKRYQKVKVEIDEKLLKEIANMTGAQFFRATDNEKLKAIYDEIDQLEKTKIELTTYQRYTERYLSFALLAGLLLVSEIFLKQTLFRSIT